MLEEGRGAQCEKRDVQEQSTTMCVSDNGITPGSSLGS